MTEYCVEVSGSTLIDLIQSFRNGPLIEHDGQELHFLTEEKFAAINGVKVDIFSNEHPPPHFRVFFQGSTANFSIKTCEKLNGSGEVLKYERNIRKWWKSNKTNLIDFWNEKRPSDCPFGTYKEE